MMDEFKEMDYNNVPNISLKPRRELVIEELQIEYDKQLDKISNINDFMSLYGMKHEIVGDLRTLKNQTIELKNFVDEARANIQYFRTVQLPQTKSLIKRMRNLNLKMLQLLEETETSTNERKVISSSTVVVERGNNMLSDIVTPNNARMMPKYNTITPKMHQSPFKLRADPRLMQQLEKQFEINIKTSDFDKIPKYLKGRDTLDEVQSFLQTVIIKCFFEKYTLLHRDRENVQPNHMQRWKMYRSQMEYFPGEMFITEGDIATLIGRMMDKKMCSRISMLRHLHVLQEVRHGSATCYIWKINK